MVIDKGLGLHGLQDLLDTAGPYIDLIKLGWGTSAVFDASLLEKKIALCRQHDIRVSPGGTFLEVAFDRGQTDEFFRYIKSLGFSAVEVSNGIHQQMSLDDKRRLISRAAKEGFYVVSEVGRKMPEEDRHLDSSARAREVLGDLDAGSAKVIMEARESGTVGIFDAEGKVNHDLAVELFQKVDPELIIWEAPKKQQQMWLINQLGADVNIGNVPPEEVISLETLRLGLRADTFRENRRGALIVHLELGIGGALRARRRGDVIVVVDAIRASTTILQALVSGARQVVPVVSADELVGEIKVGERGGSKLPNADFNNSPLELRAQDLAGKEVVLTSTNGTECIRAAKGDGSVVLIGSVTNCKAAARAAAEIAHRSGRKITLLAAGRNNLPAEEDRIGVTEILRHIDAAIPRGVLEPFYSENFERDFLTSDSGMNLASLGYAQDVIYCAQPDLYDAVPVFDGRAITLLDAGKLHLFDK